MILPQNPTKLRDEVFRQLWICTRSMGSRANAYTRREAVYRRGASGIIRGRVNKAGPAVDKQAALLFAPHLIKFWGKIPSDDEGEEFIHDRVEAVADAVKLAWNDLMMDEIFPMGVQWGLVDGCRILSIIPQKRTDWEVELRADLIHPRDFGVSNETGAMSWVLDRQQGVAVRSYHSLEELDRWVMRRPDRATVLSRLAYVQMDTGDRGSRITGITPGSTVLQAKPENWPSVSGTENADMPSPICAEFYELRLFDDDQEDWRVFTISGDTILRDRRGSEVGIPQRLPYVKICPDEDPESFWGISLIENLTPAQDWFLARIEGMDEKFRKSLRPSTAAIGLGQSFEEKIASFNRPGGRLAVANPNAKIQQFPPELSDSDFTMMSMISDALQEQAQLRPGMFGKGESGVRSEGMQQMYQKLASAEIAVKSLRVESRAAEVADLIFQSMRRFSTVKLFDANGRKFRLSEFPASVKIKVDGHSSSPIAMEDHKVEAKGLLQLGLIKPSRAIRYIAPTMEDAMLHELKDIEFAKMVASAKIKQEQEMKRGGKESAGIEG